MDFIERVMRVMTHINAGAALGLAAWVLWSGFQVVTGHITPGYSPAEFSSLVRLAHAGASTPLELLPATTQGRAMPPCHEPRPAVRRADWALTGADL